MKKVLFTLLTILLLVSPVIAADTSEFNYTDKELESRISVGMDHFTFVDHHNNLWAWGSNWFGELCKGDNNLPDELFPVKTLTDVEQVSAGTNTTAVIKKDGSLWTYGHNESGQLGDGEGKPYAIRAAEPYKVLDNVAQVSMGEYNGAAITKDGSLYTWGLNNFGQLGDGTHDSLLTNKARKIMDNVKSVCVGDRCMAAITNNNELYTWGVNYHYRLGNGEDENSFTDTPEKILDDVKKVALGDTHSAALKNDGSLYLWGANTIYELGMGSTDNKSVSKPKYVTNNVKDVALGQQYTLILKNDGTVYGVGDNGSGRVGTGSSESFVREFTRVLDNAVAIYACNQHSLAVKKDGSIWVWGGSVGESNDYYDKGYDNASNTPYRIFTSFIPLAKATNYPSVPQDEIITVEAKIDPEPKNSGDPFLFVKEKKDYHYADYGKVIAVGFGSREFYGWFDGETCVSKNLDYYFSVTENVNLVARFEKDPNAVEIEEINIVPESLELEEGQTNKLTVEFIPSDAEKQNLVWFSADEGVATVDNGTVTAIAPGTVIITAKTEDEKHSDSIAVTVKKKAHVTPSPSPSNPTPEEDTKSIPIYRIYNPLNGEHLYTVSPLEVSVNTSNGWTDEGIGWYAPSSGTPVYRLYNSSLQNHLYTTDENEVNTLLQIPEWTADNNRQPVFYSGGSVPIYRVYNENLRGLHHLTTDLHEYNILPQHGWTQEAIALYAQSGANV